MKNFRKMSMNIADSWRERTNEYFFFPPANPSILPRSPFLRFFFHEPVKRVQFRRKIFIGVDS